MVKIDYINILKQSWDITWHNKYLWWFGFFLALGGGGFNFNFPLGGENKEVDGEKFFQTFRSFLDNYWELAAAGLAILLILTVAVIILKTISRGGLIKSVSEITRGKESNFKAGFSAGKKYFWKVFLTGLLIGFFILGIIVALLSPVIFLIYLKSYIWAALLGVTAVILIIILGILASFIREYAYIYLITSDLGIRSSLESAFQLFRKNIWRSILFSLILMAVGMIAGLLILFSIFLIALPFLMLGFMLYALLSKLGMIITVVLGSLVIIAAIMLLQSVFETFRQTSWILFFREIASVKTEEEVTEKESVKTAEKILDAGEA